MTLIEMVQAQSARLEQAGVSFGHGTSNAFDEAAWLVLWALELPPGALDEHAQRPLSKFEESDIESLVERRIETRKPAAYLTREAWLQGIAFYVDERAIVPRSFIAELIADATLDLWLAQDARSALDLCTGNGSLAVLAALAWPQLEIDTADISEQALMVARINVDKHELGERITLLHSDMMASVNGPYDLILCNPPYVNAASMAELPAEYHAEPALALAGGADGMDLIRRVLRDAPVHMTEHAALVLEIGNERQHFERAFARLEAVWLETSAGPDHVVLVTREQLARWNAA
jgi:ribosomal protein L3 glutamine methyltransferase